ETGARLVHQHRMVRPDGDTRWVRVEAVPEMGADGRCVRMFGITQDITDRKRVELALAESQRMLTDAIESIPAGVVLFGRNDGRLRPNSPYRAMFPPLAAALVPGTSSDELLQAVVKLPPAHASHVEAWIETTLRIRRAGEAASERQLGDGRW